MRYRKNVVIPVVIFAFLDIRIFVNLIPDDKFGEKKAWLLKS
jgi:hypothetical protein